MGKFAIRWVGGWGGWSVGGGIGGPPAGVLLSHACPLHISPVMPFPYLSPFDYVGGHDFKIPQNRDESFIKIELDHSPAAADN